MVNHRGSAVEPAAYRVTWSGHSRWLGSRALRKADRSAKTTAYQYCRREMASYLESMGKRRVKEREEIRSGR